MLCFHKHSVSTHDSSPVTLKAPPPQDPFSHNAWSHWTWDANNVLEHFAKVAQGTSLNLFPLFGHAVIVQSSPGRFPCVGRDRSHQEADQVISIISFNFTFRDKFILWRKKKPQ